MKVIDLLNKIANGEEVPKKIRYRNKSYIYSNECRGYYLGTNPEKIETFAEFRLVKRFSNGSMLNDEVEIIEEDKKIEKIDMFDYFTGYDFDNTSIDLRKRLEFNFQTLNNKINEIIDYIMEDK